MMTMRLSSSSSSSLSGGGGGANTLAVTVVQLAPPQNAALTASSIAVVFVSATPTPVASSADNTLTSIVAASAVFTELVTLPSMPSSSNAVWTIPPTDSPTAVSPPLSGYRYMRSISYK